MSATQGENCNIHESNLVPRVVSYRGRVGEDPGNEVGTKGQNKLESTYQKENSAKKTR